MRKEDIREDIINCCMPNFSHYSLPLIDLPFLPDIMLKREQMVAIIDIIMTPNDVGCSCILSSAFFDLIEYLESRKVFGLPCIIFQPGVGLRGIEIRRQVCKIFPYQNDPYTIQKYLERQFNWITKKVNEALQNLSSSRNCLPNLQFISQYTPFVSFESQTSIIEKLKNSIDLAITEELCYFIGRTKNPKFAHYLFPVVKEQDPRVKERAIESLLELWKAAFEQIKDSAFSNEASIWKNEEEIKELFNAVTKLLP